MGQRHFRVLQVISSSATSGAERHVLDLSEELLARGHQVQLVCPSEGWLTHAARTAGIQVHISPMKGKGWWTTMALIRRIVRRGKIDLIHTHLTRAAYIGFSAGFLTRLPVVTSVHIANNDAIYKHLARGRNRLVAVSGFVRGMLKGRGIHDRYIDTVYNGTDFLDYEPSDSLEVKRELGIPSDRKLIGVVGRVCRDKGHLEFIRAMTNIRHRHPDAHAVFVGRWDDDFKQEVEDAVAAGDLHDHVTFTGLRSDIPRLLDAFDVAAMPSVMETFGLAAVEAMARSRPVVASRVGALPEVVRHGQTGLLVSTDSHELEDALDYLLGQEHIRREMGECGRKLVEEKFSNETMAIQFEDVYARSLNTR